jgi:hypothetical protein
VDDRIYSAIEIVDLRKRLHGLAKVRQIDLCEWADCLGRSRPVDIEYFVAVPEKLGHARTAHFAAASCNNYTRHKLSFASLD